MTSTAFATRRKTLRRSLMLVQTAEAFNCAIARACAAGQVDGSSRRRREAATSGEDGRRLHGRLEGLERLHDGPLAEPPPVVAAQRRIAADARDRLAADDPIRADRLRQGVERAQLRDRSAVRLDLLRCRGAADSEFPPIR